MLNTNGTLARTVPMVTVASQGSITLSGQVARQLPIVLFVSQGNVTQPIVNTNGTVAFKVPMVQLDAAGMAAYPMVVLPLGATRVNLDHSATAFSFVPIRTSVRLDPSATRARNG